MLGQTAVYPFRHLPMELLQWRAEQLIDQTQDFELALLLDRVASMEGRAIARPNEDVGRRVVHPQRLLQWRAEQLLDQTTWMLAIAVVTS